MVTVYLTTVCICWAMCHWINVVSAVGNERVAVVACGADGLEVIKPHLAGQGALRPMQRLLLRTQDAVAG